MVGAIKRWLGIDVLEHENLKLARALQSAHARIGKLEVAAGKAALELQKDLASDPAKPKPVPKPHRANWRTFRAALERDAEIEQQP